MFKVYEVLIRYSFQHCVSQVPIRSKPPLSREQSILLPLTNQPFSFPDRHERGGVPGSSWVLVKAVSSGSHTMGVVGLLNLLLTAVVVLLCLATPAVTRLVGSWM